MKALLRAEPELIVDKEHLMVVSPDEGAMHRAVYFSNVLGVNMGMFYKRRDYSTVINGKNPIVPMNSWAMISRERMSLSWTI